MKDKIKDILPRANNLTAEDKRVIRECYKTSGMEFSINTRCHDCWRDALIVIAKELGVIGCKEEPTRGVWRFAGYAPAIWMPYRIRLDDKTPQDVIIRYAKECPLQTLFVRYE